MPLSASGVVRVIASGMEMIRLSSYRSVYSLVSKFFRDARLRVVFSFHPLLIGGMGINVYRAIYRDGAPIATPASRGSNWGTLNWHAISAMPMVSMLWTTTRPAT